MHKKYNVAPIVLLLLAPQAAGGQALTSPATENAFERIMTRARDTALHAEPLGSIVTEVGQQFVGRPYAAGLLDAPSEEILVVDLTQFDCVLFVEVILAVALGIAVEDYSLDAFKQRLMGFRYRDGTLDGYCSRLHYFTEWIADNERRGHVQDVTQVAGGVLVDKTLNFMSSHRSSYSRLVANDSLYEGIQDMERRLRGVVWYQIPQNSIEKAYPQLRDGDILAMSTHIVGLDVVHTGLAIAQPDGSFGMLHASTSQGVTVSPDLAAYVRDNKSQIGIVIARLVDNR